MAKQKNTTAPFDFVDIPVITLLGAAAGWFLVGIIQATLGAIFEAGENEILSIRSIIVGASCVAISVLILVFTHLYWIIIPKRCGAVYPELNGFGTIPALMAMASSVLLATEFCVWGL